MSPGPRRGSGKPLSSTIKKSKSSGDIFKLFGASNKSFSGSKSKPKTSGYVAKQKKSSPETSRPDSRSGSKTPTTARERELSGGRPTSKTPTRDMDEPIPRSKKLCECVLCGTFFGRKYV